MGVNTIDWYILFNTLDRKKCKFTHAYLNLRANTISAKDYEVSIVLTCGTTDVYISIFNEGISAEFYKQIKQLVINVRNILNSPKRLSSERSDLFSKVVYHDKFSMAPNGFLEQLYISSELYMTYTLKKGKPVYFSIVVRYRGSISKFEQDSEDYNLFKRLYLECQNLTY